jgi:hypothetical protein
MPKRILRVVKWIGTTPAIGMCSACERQFTLPVGALRNVVEARTKMQALFDEHQCESASDVEGGAKPI